MKALTVGKLAKKYGLSRTTLLYYDSIGLLPPTHHDLRQTHTLLFHDGLFF